MRIEKRLNIRLAVEDIGILESEEDLETSIAEPNRSNYRAVVDAIKKFLGMDARDLYQFAQEGGSIEEDTIVIEGLTPQTILEQEIKRVVQSGNYAKTLEVRMMGPGGVVYKGFIVAKLEQPNERIEKAMQARMAEWKPGQKVPFDWYKTEAEALKVMANVEAKAARKSPTPAQPIKQKVSKPPVNEVAAKMAEHMGAKEAAEEIRSMSSENLVKAAELGRRAPKSGNWEIIKAISLGYLALTALVTGASGLAALVIGYLAVKGIEYSKRPRQ